MEPSTGIFRKYAYFDSDFPFCIWRETDTPDQFGAGKRFRREFWKIILVLSGSGTKIINEERYPIRAGSLFLIHPEDRTTILIDSPTLEICNIVFMPEMLRDQLRELQDDFGFFSIFRWDSSSDRPDLPGGRLYIAEDDPEIRRVIRTMESEFDRSRQNYQPRLKYLLLELLILFARKGGRRFRRRNARSVTEYVNHLIGAHYKEGFSLDAVAAATGIAKSRLCRLFRAETGMTIMEALRGRRLEEAAALLASTERSVSEICFCSGFRDLSYFYRSFSARYGKNPGEFRRRFSAKAAAR